MKINNYSLVMAEGQCANWVVLPRSQKSIFKQVSFQKIPTLQIIIRCFPLSQDDVMYGEKSKLNILSLSWFTA